MRYPEAISWLDLLHAEAALKREDLGLERIQLLLERLDNPHQKFKSIHVAGTSGKGSTCYFIASILHAAGYKVGLNISPHLQIVNERIQINGKIISNEDFAALVEKIRLVIEQYDWPQGIPSYFETLIAMAFLHFWEEKVDFAVVEVGLGGSLDATNVIQPVISVITSISFDHMNLIGPTLEKIAENKAGIIKENVPVIVGNIPSPAFPIIQQKALEKNAPIIHSIPCNLKEMNLEHLKFFARFQDNEVEFETSAIGTFQLHNAAHAIKVIEFLVANGFEINTNALQNGFLNVDIPARFEVMQKKSIIVLDGAHNVEKIQSLVKTLELLNVKTDFLVGILKSKQAKEMIENLATVSSRFVFVQPDLPRNYWSTEELSQFAQEKNIPSTILKGDETALFDFIQNYSGNLLVITGSLYLTGMARNYWNQDVKTEIRVSRKY